MSTLLNTSRPQSAQASADFNAHPTYLRHPETGIIHKLFHKDTITRCLREGFTPSTEQDMRAQAVEMAELQGRPLPTATPPAAAAKPVISK